MCYQQIHTEHGPFPSLKKYVRESVPKDFFQLVPKSRLLFSHNTVSKRTQLLMTLRILTSPTLGKGIKPQERAMAAEDET